MLLVLVVLLSTTAMSLGREKRESIFLIAIGLTAFGEYFFQHNVFTDYLQIS